MMQRGEEKTLMVHLRNVGDAPLKITRVRPSCPECLPERELPGPLAPGEETELRVTFSATDVPGEHTAHLTFHSNDALEPLQRATLKVRIVAAEGFPRLEVMPQKVELGVLLVGLPVRRRLRLRNVGNGVLRFEGLMTSQTLEAVPATPDPLAGGEELVLEVRCRSRGPGQIRGRISLTSNDPERPVVHVPVEGYAATPAQVQDLTGAVLVWFERDEEGRVIEIRVSNASDHALSVVVPPGSGGDSAVLPARRQEIAPAGGRVDLKAGPHDSAWPSVLLRPVASEGTMQETRPPREENR
jgi:hypothetical protein